MLFRLNIYVMNTVFQNQLFPRISEKRAEKIGKKDKHEVFNLLLMATLKSSFVSKHKTKLPSTIPPPRTNQPSLKPQRYLGVPF